MRARLLGALLPLVVVLVAGFGWVFAREAAERATQHDFLTRRNDAATIADAAALALAAGDTASLRAMLDRYAEIDGSAVVVLDGDGEIIAASEGADRALADGVAGDAAWGTRRDGVPVVWPWSDGPLVVEEPVTDGRTTSGVVVVAAPTDALRSKILARWALVGAAIVTGLVLLALLAHTLVRWALRPVRQLDRAAHAIAGGDLEARVPHDHGAPELQRLVTSFNEMADSMASALERERAFVADASHHLGNLLTPMRLRIEALRGDADGAAIDAAVGEVARLEQVVDRLLELARADDQPAGLELTDAVEATREAMRTWEPVAAAQGVDLSLVAPSSAPVRVVPGAIQESLDHLIENSLKYGAGSPIRLEVLRGVEHVRIVVRDGGPGLAVADLHKAQGRFWRGVERQNQPGTGLGLAVVDALAEASGGRFELRRARPRGLEADLVFPPGISAASGRTPPRPDGAVPAG